MKFEHLEAVFRSLNSAGVRYLVAGGLAVNAHGYQRLTGDIDLVIQLNKENVERASQALAKLNYQPSAPVRMSEFADERKRTEWIQSKNMTVFGLANDDPRRPAIDLFVKEPFDFAREYELALVAEVAPGVEVRFVSIPALIEMKKLAGRPRDMDDSASEVVAGGESVNDDKAWEASTWEGNRRLMLRRALRLTVRERLQCLESLGEINRRFAEMPRRIKGPSKNGKMQERP